jgi:hypothetical protein
MPTLSEGVPVASAFNVIKLSEISTDVPVDANAPLIVVVPENVLFPAIL